MGLWINNSLNTAAKSFRNSYTFNDQDDRAAMFFVVVKTVRPDTISGYSDMKTKLETMKMYQFKHNISKANLHLS